MMKVLAEKVFWWKFNRRIARKAAAAKTLRGVLRLYFNGPKVQRCVHQYIYDVRRVQNLWRREWVFARAQVDAILREWLASDLRRGVIKSDDVSDLDARDRRLRLGFVQAHINVTAM